VGSESDAIEAIGRLRAPPQEGRPACQPVRFRPRPMFVCISEVVGLIVR